jgi:hypothetical protein
MKWKLKPDKKMIHFSGRRHTKLGIASTVIGIIVVLGFFIISLLSGLAGGKGGFAIGVTGILLLILSVIGFVLAYKALRKKDIFYRFPIIGAVLNGIMLILLLVIYLLGIG